jgi:putative DNA primase/helicase
LIPGCPRLHERAVASADFDAAVTHAGILHIQRAPAAPEPRQWLEFLGQLWGPDDQEAINTLQEVFGYCLTGDTGQQKAFLLVGPKRSGKGTIARVLARLVGIGGNAVAPTLAALGTNFGLAH